MDTRREFLKKAAFLSGAAGVWTAFPDSIRQALAIDPEQGTTFLDAEHVVVLMQENRSFDHSFGTLRGVRGFNDPRAHVLPDRKPVWLQTNTEGQTFAPFRLKMHETNATWMGSLPHGWTDQVDARNHGRYDRWLTAKPSGHRDYAKMPLTLGYYSREDIPFYYALADAFTVCDQHFCSSLTGTTPNRLYLWTGKVRESDDDSKPPCVRNEEVDYGREAVWTTFPERLEDLGISWKVYQNEISLDSGFVGEEDSWLSNFTDNPLEWFTQYNVRFASGFRGHLDRQAKSLPDEIEALKKQPETEESKKKIADLTKRLERVQADREQWSQANWDKLSQREKNIHNKAFSINSGDPDYRSLEAHAYTDGAEQRSLQVPKGDVLHQFREDVKNGQLPAVSWVVGSATFSDHPGEAWYGAWYVSEVLDILSQNPEVWKKTIFILTYDENDGYFDHVPPFVAPNPKRPETGQVSKGIDSGVEFVQLEADQKRKPGNRARESSIGLGYRVPMVVASPWSRGGCVNSQVFDHTSVLQLMEKWLSHKTNKKVEEPNISAWRRTVCGDLTSVFQPYNGEKIEMPKFVERDEFLEGIHKARFKQLPSGYKGLSAEEIEQVKRDASKSEWMPAQEKGTRRACPLPYQLYAHGSLSPDKTKFAISMEARNSVFGKKTAGSPFNAYAYGASGDLTARSFAVSAGDKLVDSWDLNQFPGGNYHLRVDGPNGFMREFKGSAQDPSLDIQVEYAGGKTPDGKVTVKVANRGTDSVSLELRDNGYKAAAQKKTLAAGATVNFTVDTKKNFGWYDFSILMAARQGFERRCAGRVETGQWSQTDPVMGRTI